MSARLILLFFLFCASVAGAQTTILHFDFNSAALTNEAKGVLDKYITARKIQSLGIFGHTDQVGSEDYNLWLSIERARRVRDYMLSRGVDVGKIGIVRGYGTERLISNGTDEMSRQLNRRVVLMNGYTPAPGDAQISAMHLAMKKPSEGTPAVQIASTTPVPQKAAPTPLPALKKEQPIVKQQKSEKLIEDIKDRNTKAGENIALKNINFFEGSHAFLPTATNALEDLTETMRKVPSLEVEIQGHVCCQDGETDALDNATGEMSLSVNRAKAVYDYLIQKGIEKSRLSYKGLAHQFPLIANEVTEADRVTNRRVEIKIIKK